MERLAYTYIDNQFQRFKLISKRPHHPISGVLVTVLASSLLGCVFDPWSGQTKDYKRQENKDKYYRSETQKNDQKPNTQIATKDNTKFAV
jgi:hypothetical protein